jgi:hypothetical protein
MAVLRFIAKSDGVFSPEVITAISAAFDDALNKLKLVDRDDPVAEIVARKITEIARQGECDPARLSAAAVDSIQQMTIPWYGFR